MPRPSIEGWHAIAVPDPRSAIESSKAAAFLLPASHGDPHDAEFCALVVWSGRPVAKLPNGALCIARHTLASATTFEELRDRAKPAVPLRTAEAAAPWRRIYSHLVNAELTSPAYWLRHPIRAATRVIPLRVKEQINRAARRPVFDLSFYLRFQMQAVLAGQDPGALLRYQTPRAEAKRVALLTPHLGVGGAESVLLELAGALDRSRCEIFLLATQSHDSRWLPRWKAAADHVYDLAALVPPERVVAALTSVAANWEFDTVVLHNSLAAYSAIPHLRKELPRVRVIDLIHAVDPEWDFISTTAEVASQIDLRGVGCESGRDRLLRTGVPLEKIRLIRTGVDLEALPWAPPRPEGVPAILFAGRLNAVKRPLLLVDVARELVKLRGRMDFRMVVAGDGPLKGALRAKIHRSKLESVFDLRGHVPSMAEALVESDVVVLPSRGEGIPLVILEALAVGRPVVSARVGAVCEAVDTSTGVLIDPGPGEVRRFATALQRVLTDPAARAAMGEAGRRKIESDYDAKRTRAAYRAVVQG